MTKMIVRTLATVCVLLLVLIVGQGRARTGRHGFSNLISHKSNFMTTSHILRLFSAGVEALLPGMTVVYVAGGWICLPGACGKLRRARALGDYLVGVVHGDYVAKRKGAIFLS